MGEWLMSLGPGVLTPSAIAGILLLGIIFGQLVPVRSVNSLVERLDQQVDDWREAFLASEAARREQDKQVSELLESIRLLDSAPPPPRQLSTPDGQSRGARSEHVE